MIDAAYPKILKEGQRFFDEPVYAMPKPISIIERSVHAALNPNKPLPRAIQTGTQRVRLRWVNPDGTPK